MRFSTLSTVALLPLLALAQDSSSTSLTTTITSTQTLTKTITVSEVVASVTSTYGLHNSTATFAPTAGTIKPSTTLTTAPTVSPQNFLGAAPALSGMYAGSAGLVVMIAAALL